MATKVESLVLCSQHACIVSMLYVTEQELACPQCVVPGAFKAMQETTNYHFDVKPSSLRGALERFSQFFIAPLCKADALEREVNAVDNEFSGMLLRYPLQAV
jgi:hypothetical protein